MFLEPCLGNCSWTRCLTLVYRNLAWEPVLGCSWGGWRRCWGKTFPRKFPGMGRGSSRYPGRGSQARLNSRNRLQVRFPKTVPKQGLSSRFQARFQAGTRLAGTGSQASVPRKSWFPSKISRNNWEPLLANLFLGTLLENLFLAILLEELFLGTLLGNLFLKTLLGNLLLGALASSWQPLLGNLFLVTLPGNLAWEPCWEPLARNLAWEPCLAWEPLLRTLLGGTSWEPLGNLACSWEPCLGTCSWEPGNPCLGFSWKRRPLPGNLVPNLARCGFGCPDLLRDL